METPEVTALKKSLKKSLPHFQKGMSSYAVAFSPNSDGLRPDADGSMFIYDGKSGNFDRRFRQHWSKLPNIVTPIYHDLDPEAEAIEAAEHLYLQPWKVAVPEFLHGSNGLHKCPPRLVKVVHDELKRMYAEETPKMQKVIQDAGFVTPSTPIVPQQQEQYPLRTLSCRKRRHSIWDRPIASYNSIPPTVK
jgi:hypothetical protein